jgi:hypothetical protein
MLRFIAENVLSTHIFPLVLASNVPASVIAIGSVVPGEVSDPWI